MTIPEDTSKREKDIYKKGWLDSMRQSGKLLTDVPDEDLTLSYDWQFAIERGFNARRFMPEKDYLEEFHLQYHELVVENIDLQQEIEDLRELLKVCNSLREYEMSA